MSNLSEKERKLLEMQAAYRREQDPAKKAAIRARYIKAHAEWATERQHRMEV